MKVKVYRLELVQEKECTQEEFEKWITSDGLVDIKRQPNGMDIFYSGERIKLVSTRKQPSEEIPSRNKHGYRWYYRS